MPISARVVFGFVGGALASVVFAGAAGGQPLQSKSSRLGLSEDHRSIGLLALAPERNFIDPATSAPLYSIYLVEQKAPVTAREAAKIAAKQEGTALVVTAEHEKPVPLQVACRIELDPDREFFAARIAIRSPQPIKIAAVQYPTVTLKLPLSGTGADDAILLPYCDGYIWLDPTKNNPDRTLNYPGAASMQLLAAFDKSAGVYVASRDASCHAKTLVVQRRGGKSLDLAMRHLTPQAAVTEWALPYDVAITAFKVPAETAGWEAAANLYRGWAVQQPWCAKTLKQRVEAGDVPKWLVDPSLFYAFSLRGQDAQNKMVDRLALVPEQARRWREALGGPVTFMTMGWEKRGSWVTPDYFPPFGGAEAYTKVTQALRAEGDHPLVFLSGLKWTLLKERPDAEGKMVVVADQQAEFERRGGPHAISDDQRKPLIAGKPGQDVGQYAQICPTTALAAQILLGVTRQCQELGIECVQVDQIVGGGSPPCFHPDHRHPPGGGNWSGKAIYELFGQLRKEGKARDPKFAFAIEEPGEFFIPLLDTCHTRDYQQNRWPRMGSATVGVPLFTHVYHDYMHGYGGDSAYVSKQPSDVAMYHQGMNLVCGKAAAVAVWTRWFDPATIDPAQKRLLRSHFELWRGPAREFLVYGQRLASPDVEVARIPITFTDKDPARDKRTLEVPSVLSSRWRLPDGRTGRVFACIARTAVKFNAMGQSLTLEPGEAVFQME